VTAPPFLTRLPELLRPLVPLLAVLLAAVVVAGAVLRIGHSSDNARSRPRPRTPPSSAQAAPPGPAADSASTTTAARPSLSAAAATELNNQGYARIRIRDSALTAAELNNEGYARMRKGDYVGALPLLEQAVERLTGTRSFDEAYADFNLANTRYHLGECTDVMALLDRSQQIQGELTPIDALRNAAQKTCG
jgi:hypothetical protein